MRVKFGSKECPKFVIAMIPRIKAAAWQVHRQRVREVGLNEPWRFLDIDEREFLPYVNNPGSGNLEVGSSEFKEDVK